MDKQVPIRAYFALSVSALGGSLSFTELSPVEMHHDNHFLYYKVTDGPYKGEVGIVPITNIPNMVYTLSDNAQISSELALKTPRPRLY